MRHHTTKAVFRTLGFVLVASDWVEVHAPPVLLLSNERCRQAKRSDWSEAVAAVMLSTCWGLGLGTHTCQHTYDQQLLWMQDYTAPYAQATFDTEL